MNVSNNILTKLINKTKIYTLYYFETNKKVWNIIKNISVVNIMVINVNKDSKMFHLDKYV